MTLHETTSASLPRLVPLDEAARMAGLNTTDLEKMVQSGQVLAFTSAHDEVLIPIDAQGQLFMTQPSAPLTHEAEQLSLAAVPESAPISRVEPSELEADGLNARLRQIRRQDFAHLEGVPITVSEAARKYRVQKHTILAWTRRYTSVLRVLERGYRLLLDEAGVAYLAAIHHARKAFGAKSGSPLVDESGAPNLIKHPSLSAYRKHRLKHAQD